MTGDKHQYLDSDISAAQGSQSITESEPQKNSNYPVSVYLPREIRAEIQTLADSEEMTRHAFLQYAILAFVAEYKAGNLTIEKETKSVVKKPATRERVDINQASQEELARLPNIGKSRAAAIIQVRTELGGFSVIDDLVSVDGIGDELLNEIRPLITIRPQGR